VPLLLFSSEQFWPLIFLLSFVSIGVFLFVFFGIIHSTYDKLLSIGDYTPKRVASERLTTKVANIVFPLAVGIYVISGLLLTLVTRLDDFPNFGYQLWIVRCYR